MRGGGSLVLTACLTIMTCLSSLIERTCLLQSPNYRSIHEKVEAPGVLLRLFEEEKPNVVIHLAAQAGVRYSIENPRAYLESNIVGTFELLEAARAFPPDHMLLASTSSAYGANENMPYKENDKSRPSNVVLCGDEEIHRKYGAQLRALV